MYFSRTLNLHDEGRSGSQPTSRNRIMFNQFISLLKKLFLDMETRLLFFLLSTTFFILCMLSNSWKQVVHLLLISSNGTSTIDIVSSHLTGKKRNTIPPRETNVYPYLTHVITQRKLSCPPLSPSRQFAVIYRNRSRAWSYAYACMTEHTCNEILLSVQHLRCTSRNSAEIENTSCCAISSYTYSWFF